MIEKVFAKQQGETFGETTRVMLGNNDYQSPSFLPDGTTDLAATIGNYAGALAGIAAIIAVGALTWGGIMWASSAGDEEKIAKAKGFIKWSIFGFILTLIAWSIVEIVKRTFTA